MKKREFAGEEYWARPVPSLGDPKARLLIIGLAPAAHGANRTGQLFTGDSSGSWLYEALHRFGWSNQPNSLRRGDGLVLTDCWITAAAHCAPPDNKPTREELARCRPYLEAELRLLPNVRTVLALGQDRLGERGSARPAGGTASPRRERPPFGHDREATLPDGTVLVTSFHPSRQNTNTGKLTREMWYGVFERIRRAKGDRETSTPQQRRTERGAAHSPGAAARAEASGRKLAPAFFCGFRPSPPRCVDPDPPSSPAHAPDDPLDRPPRRDRACSATRSR